MNEVQASRQSLEPLLAHLPVAAMVFRENRIIAANERMCALAGRPLSELLDATDPIHAFAAEADGDRVFARYQSRVAGRAEPEEYDAALRGRDGSPIPARVRISKFPPGGPDAFLVLFTDERARSRSAELIRAFVDVSVSAQRETTRDGMFRLVQERLRAAGLSVNVSAINGEYFELVALAGSAPHGGIVAVRERWPQRVPVSAFRESLPPPHSPHGTFIEDLPALVARAVGKDRRELEALMPANGMFCYVPVDGVPRYALSATGAGLDATTATAFGLLGQQLGASLETLRRLDELAHSNEELSLLLELGSAALGSLDLSSVLQAGARTAVRTLRCSAAYILLPDAEGTALELAAMNDPERHSACDVGFAIPLSMRSLSSLAFATREPQTAPNAERDERIDPSIVKHFGAHSVLAVPLLSHDTPRGVLTLMSRGERSFGAQDVRVATHVAQLLSVAMENARLYGEERARAEEMTLLNEVSRSFAGAIEMKPLLMAAGQALRKLVDASNWFVLLHDPTAGVLRVAACSPEHEEFMRGVELRLDQPSLSAEVVRQRRAMQAQEPLLGEIASRQLVDHLHERAVLVVPLVARDEVLGAVVLDDTQRARVFSEAEMERTTAVCQQIALALLSARLYEDLRKSYADLARAQAELIERERLAALGEMAASVAHEVRNPLGVIFNSVGGLKRLLQPTGDVRLLLDIVAEEADRLNRMVGDLLEYSRPLRPAVQAVNVQTVVDEAVGSVLPTRYEHDVAVRISIEAGLSPVNADARLLRQALVNLLTNSVQAMPHGGILTISAGRVHSDGAPHARIAVHDTGPGIPPEVRGKVFQPFFTTKPTGTGLGLAVVKRVIDGQGGRVQLAECDRGTEFHLFLPLSG
ncbi:MAG TPA: GAF domain-containing protein [Myxococcales bacterium]|jgi:signal transduction histidine kinase|nr:GAF domain-containing protein [Myxococcales bacterium]